MLQNLYTKKPGTRYHWWVDPSGNVSRHDDPSSSMYFLRTVNSTSGPRPKDRPMPSRPYYLNVQEIQMNHHAHYWYANGVNEYAEGPALHPAIVEGVTYYPSYDWSNLYNQALSDFNEKVRGSLDLSVDLAQMGQVRKLFQLTKQAEEYTAQWLKKYGKVKFVGKAWLMYVYGIKPLMSSIFGTADELIRFTLNSTESFRARATRTYSPESVTIRTIFDHVNFKVSGSMKVSVTIGGIVTVKDFDLSRWSSLNPVSVALELTPYSFVADWLYDMGGYLRNLETALLHPGSFRNGYVTKLSAGTLKAYIHAKGGNGSEGYVSNWDGTVRHLDINRTVLGSYPLPVLPRWDVQLGSSRLFSAASLLTTFLGTPPRNSYR